MKRTKRYNIAGRRNKTPSEQLNDLIHKKGQKGAAKVLGVAPRTLRSYYSVIDTGEKQRKSDRTPPDGFYDKLKQATKKANLRVTVGSETSEKKMKAAYKDVALTRPQVWIVRAEFEYFIKGVGYKSSWQSATGATPDEAVSNLQEIRESLLENESLRSISIVDSWIELYE